MHPDCCNCRKNVRSKLSKLAKFIFYSSANESRANTKTLSLSEKRAVIIRHNLMRPDFQVCEIASILRNSRNGPPGLTINGAP